jgi:phosphohistidine phosphatase SixA
MRTPPFVPDVRRRRLLAAGAALAWPLPGRADDGALAALRAGGCVAAFRHANAPGTFDPPGFRLGSCETQRNLDDAGRAQARRLGDWFRTHGLTPAAVRSSPWCRCLDTARLAFGAAEAWPALGSPRGADTPADQTDTLRRALAGLPAGRFEVWVSHQFTLSALAGRGTAAGEGLVLAATPDGSVRVLATLPAA